MKKSGLNRRWPSVDRAELAGLELLLVTRDEALQVVQLRHLGSEGTNVAAFEGIAGDHPKGIAEGAGLHRRAVAPRELGEPDLVTGKGEAGAEIEDDAGGLVIELAAELRRRGE